MSESRLLTSQCQGATISSLDIFNIRVQQVTRTLSHKSNTKPCCNFSRSRTQRMSTRFSWNRVHIFHCYLILTFLLRTIQTLLSGKTPNRKLINSFDFVSCENICRIRSLSLNFEFLSRRLIFVPFNPPPPLQVGNR